MKSIRNLGKAIFVLLISDGIYNLRENFENYC